MATRPKRAAGRWDRERVAAAICEWARETGRAPLSSDWAPGSARSAGRLGRELCKWELERGRWPGTLTVYRVFGSWSAALEAAGLDPERGGNGKGAHAGLAERVASARRLRAGGMAVADIAGELGVAVQTVYHYLNARECPACGGPLVRGSRLCRSCDDRGWGSPVWTSEDVLAAARDWMRLTGRAPVKNDWRGGRSQDPKRRSRERTRWPSVHAVQKLFGSWSAMLAAAGLERGRRAPVRSAE